MYQHDIMHMLNSMAHTELQCGCQAQGLMPDKTHAACLPACLPGSNAQRAYNARSTGL